MLCGLYGLNLMRLEAMDSALEFHRDGFEGGCGSVMQSQRDSSV